MAIVFDCLGRVRAFRPVVETNKMRIRRVRKMRDTVQTGVGSGTLPEFGTLSPFRRKKMASASLAITRIDTRDTEPAEALRALRERLSPQGDVVSEAGRQRTLHTPHARRAGHAGDMEGVGHRLTHL